jgi:hypothetical protein
MNLDPDILAQAALLDRPRCIKDSHRVIGLIEERIYVSRERLRADPHHKGESGGRGKVRDVPRAGRKKAEKAADGAITCCGVGKLDTTRDVVPRETSSRETGRGPVGEGHPG